ncbi:MAG: magnesium chelatase [Betaproteobacteria bacterium RIFCSPLOWO2_12_FULL_65_14]|nr:MAG: magnesium chelatase [Betaproteobacteria bacterium RIFCSPLOWO2_12_FULL_65_14]
MDLSQATGELSAGEAQRLFGRIGANISAVMQGQEAAIRKLLAAFAAGGHVLIEDRPGTGKTTLAKALAASVGASFTRVQFTPDLLPSDILGVSVFNQREQQFEFRPGPVFTSILLADEVNRASPRTQSALLEVMAEGQVSIEGRTRATDELFFVMATQNPVEFRGTYPLPEAQMDRFALCLSLGYVDAATEVAVVTAQELRHPLAEVRAVVSRAEVLALKTRVRQVRISEEIKHYIVALVQATRSAPQVLLGCGPRGSIALTQTAKALALYDGDEFVRPEHVKELAVPVLAHRMVLDPQAKFGGATGATLIADLLRETRIPA